MKNSFTPYKVTLNLWRLAPTRLASDHTQKQEENTKKH